MENQKRREEQQKEGKHAANPDPNRKDREQDPNRPGGNPDRDREQKRDQEQKR